MLPKYTVEYTTRFRRHSQLNHYSTDDPVACQEFLEELLDHGFAIHGLKPEEERYRFGFSA